MPKLDQRGPGLLTYAGFHTRPLRNDAHDGNRCLPRDAEQCDAGQISGSMVFAGV